MLLVSLALAGGLSGAEKKLVAAIDRDADRNREQLVALTDLNSGTFNPEGVRAVGERVEAELEPLGFTTRWVDGIDGRGPNLIAERIREGKPAALLVLHLDTVFGPESPFQRATIDGDRVHGPGSLDMKGGVVAVLSALRALEARGILDGLTVRIAALGDEELPGQPVEQGRAALVELGKQSDFALGYEGFSLASSGLFTARRGLVKWKLVSRTTTDGGHSSRIALDSTGYGACYEAARVLDGFREVLAEPHTTLNPGLVACGVEAAADSASLRGAGKPNRVAMRAEVVGDLRVLTVELEGAARAKMKAIVSASLPGTTSSLSFELLYPPMAPAPGNDALLALAGDIDVALGQPRPSAIDPDLRGAADVAWVSPFVPALDGLGAAGGSAHSEAEWVSLEGLQHAAKRTAILLARKAR